MRAGLAAVALVLAGCGRLGFDLVGLGDAGGDALAACLAPTGHDEDRDGVDDACDGCPHLADPAQPDADGDRVNDACDPRPTLPGDRIAIFDPLVAAAPGWIHEGAPVFAGDALQTTANGPGVGMHRPFVGNPAGAIEIGFVAGAGQAGPRQVLLQVGTSDQQRFSYCEIYADTGAMTPALAYYLYDAGYTELGRGPLTGLFEQRAARLRFELAAQGSCATTWPPAPTTPPADVPPIPREVFGFHANGVDAAIEYFVYIETPP